MRRPPKTGDIKADEEAAQMAALRQGGGAAELRLSLRQRLRQSEMTYGAGPGGERMRGVLAFSGARAAQVRTRRAELEGDTGGEFGTAFRRSTPSTGRSSARSGSAGSRRTPDSRPRSVAAAAGLHAGGAAAAAELAEYEDDDPRYTVHSGAGRDVGAVREAELRRNTRAVDLVPSRRPRIPAALRPRRREPDGGGRGSAPTPRMRAPRDTALTAPDASVHRGPPLQPTSALARDRAEMDAEAARLSRRGRRSAAAAAADEEAAPVSDDTISFAQQHAPTLVAVLRHGRELARMREARGAPPVRLSSSALQEARAGAGGVGSTTLSVPRETFGDGVVDEERRFAALHEEPPGYEEDELGRAVGPAPRPHDPAARERGVRRMEEQARERWADPLQGGRPAMPAVGAEGPVGRVQGVTGAGTADRAAPLVWWRMEGGAQTGQVVDHDLHRRRLDAATTQQHGGGMPLQSPRDPYNPPVGGRLVPAGRRFAPEHSETAFLLRPTVPLDVKGVPEPDDVVRQGREDRKAAGRRHVYVAGQRPPADLDEQGAEAAQTAAGWTMLRAGAVLVPGARYAEALEGSAADGRRRFPPPTATSATLEASRRTKRELSPRSDLGAADSASSGGASTVGPAGDEGGAWRAARRERVHPLLVAEAARPDDDEEAYARPYGPGPAASAGRRVSLALDAADRGSVDGRGGRAAGGGVASGGGALPTAFRRTAARQSADAAVGGLPMALRPSAALSGVAGAAAESTPELPPRRRGRSKPLVSEVRGVPRLGMSDAGTAAAARTQSGEGRRGDPSVVGAPGGHFAPRPQATAGSRRTASYAEPDGGMSELPRL